MDDRIVRTMREEEADLSRKLKAIREFLAAYGEATKRVEGGDRPAMATSIKPSREKVEITSYTDQTRPSVVLSMQALAIEPKPVKTRQLVDFVEMMGHEITGKDKVNSLGALLGRSADIIGHGKSGWSLADRDKAVEIIGRYYPNKNEAPEAKANDASEDGGWGAPTPSPSQAYSNEGTDA